jgi:hypothetical protein
LANGDHDWTAGETVTAANMDDYLQLQTVQKFATAAARDAALTARKREGMLTYQDDVNTLTNYSGAAWSTIGPVNGVLTSWTPTITQSVSVTFTNNYARYIRIGRLIQGWFQLSVTGAGTAANAIIVGGLPATSIASSITVGTAEIADVSASLRYSGICTYMESTTTLSFRGFSIAADNRMGVAGMTAGLAAGDTVSGCFCYEAASDA